MSYPLSAPSVRVWPLHDFAPSPELGGSMFERNTGRLIRKNVVWTCSCHGEAIFAGVVDSTTGKSVVAGKTITGFTTEAEYDMHVMDAIRSWGEPLIDEWAEKLGAKCTYLFRFSLTLNQFISSHPGSCQSSMCGKEGRLIVLYARRCPSRWSMGRLPCH